MNLSFSSLFANLLFSVIGLWLFREAKRRSNLQLIPMSLVMMFYTYFTPSPLWDWLIGIALCGAAYFFWES